MRWVLRKPDSKVAKLMMDDAADTKKNDPGAVVKPRDAIKIGDRSAPVQQFALGGSSAYEAVAYLVENKVLVMFVVSSENENLFQKDYPAFVKLVQTYKFLSSNVTVKNK